MKRRTRVTKEIVYDRIRMLGYPTGCRTYKDKWGYKQVQRYHTNYQEARVAAARHFNEEHMLYDDDNGSQYGLNRFNAININNIKDKKDVDWRELIKHACKHKKIIEDTLKKTNQKTIQLNIDKPAILVCSADWHLNSIACDYVEMQKHIEKILSTPNTYLAVCGDMTDNMFFFRRRKPSQEQVFPKSVQDIMVAKILVELCNADKLLAVLEGGNHDWEMDEAVIGVSMLEMMLRSINLYREKSVPLVEQQALIRVSINKEVYKLALIHRSRFNSVYNRTHGLKQMVRFYHPHENIDIIVGAHEHEPGYEAWWYGDDYVHVAKCGSFKINDSYSIRHYRRGVIATPCFVLNHKKKLITYFKDLDDALIYRDKIP